MEKLSELKAAAEKALELGGIKNYKKGNDAIAAFKVAATPAVILALLARIEELDKKEVWRERQSVIDGLANAGGGSMAGH